MNKVDDEGRKHYDGEIKKARYDILAIGESIDRLRGRLKSQIVQIRESFRAWLSRDQLSESV